MVVRQMEEKASEPLRIMWRADSEVTGGSNGIGVLLNLGNATSPTTSDSQASIELHSNQIAAIQVFHSQDLAR